MLDASGMTFEIITVSDGSTDGSPFTLEGFPESVVRRVSFATNVGKGHALRAGLAPGTGALSRLHRRRRRHLPRAARPLRLHHAIRAARHHHRQQAPPRVLGALPAAAPPLLVGLPAPHRRCSSACTSRTPRSGSSWWTGRVIADVLPLLRESRFALDLELLVLARRLGYTRIVEAPVRIRGALRQHDLAQGRAGCSSSTPSPSSSATPSATTTTPRWRPGRDRRRRRSGSGLNRAAATRIRRPSGATRAVVHSSPTSRFRPT